MVVGKDEFNRALKEINESYAKIVAKNEELEKRIAELENSKTAKTTKAA
jgi:uncharacterized protein YdcH (DUF465 family)